MAPYTATISVSCQINHVLVTKKQNPAGSLDPSTLLLTESLILQMDMFSVSVFCVFSCHITNAYACLHSCNTVCSISKVCIVYVIGCAGVPLYKSQCTMHTCNNAYSTKTLPKLYSIILWCPRGDYYVTSGSALQSFHHCNCMV